MLRRTIPDSIFTRYDIDLVTGTAFDKKRNKLVRSAKSEYIALSFEGKNYPLHRVIFFKATGKQPYIVDHIDRNTKNNAAANLRGFDRHNAFANNENADRRAKFKRCTRLAGEVILLPDDPQEAERQRRKYRYSRKKLGISL